MRFRDCAVKLISLAVFLAFILISTAFSVSGNKNPGYINAHFKDFPDTICIPNDENTESADSESLIKSDGLIYNSSSDSTEISQESSKDDSSYSVKPSSKTTISTEASSESEDSVSTETSSKSVSSEISSVSSQNTSSGNSNPNCKDCSSNIRFGFIWMSMDQIKNEINKVILNRFYDPIESRTCSVPNYGLEFNKFYEIMEIIKGYEWTDHKSYINAYQLKACQITVIGSNRVYTYLIFGVDEDGRYFVWSFYDYKIAYLSKEDYRYISDIFVNAD